MERQGKTLRNQAGKDTRPRSIIPAQRISPGASSLTHPICLPENPDLPKPQQPLFKSEPALIKREPALFQREPELIKREPELFQTNPALFQPEPALFNPNPASFNGDFTYFPTRSIVLLPHF